MDSVSQAVLGATVADALLRPYLGRTAVWWGLALGTLPDLDVIARPWFSQAEFLSWHRGISHGLLFTLLVAVPTAWLLRWHHRRRRARAQDDTQLLPWSRALIAAAAIGLTHVLIDCFNVYGTGLAEPFSSQWAACNIMFIIDPVFTLPLLVATLVALFGRGSVRLTVVMMSLSLCYVAWAITAKQVINQRFADHMQGLQVEEWQSAPLPLSTLAWRCLVRGVHQGEPGFWIGYASLLDDDNGVSWRWLPQFPHGQPDTASEVQAVAWFSMGYWIARPLVASDGSSGWLLADLRFGETTMASSDIVPVNFVPGDSDSPPPWIFTWNWQPGTDLVPIPPSFPEGAIQQVLSRHFGRRFAWE